MLFYVFLGTPAGPVAPAGPPQGTRRAPAGSPQGPREGPTSAQGPRRAPGFFWGATPVATDCWFLAGATYVLNKRDFYDF